MLLILQDFFVIILYNLSRIHKLHSDKTNLHINLAKVLCLHNSRVLKKNKVRDIIEEILM